MDVTWPLDLLPRVLLDVGEAVEPGRRNRRHPRVLAETVFQLAASEFRHPAVVVIDDHDFSGAQNPSRNDKGPDGIVIDHGADIPDHIDIAVGQTQHPHDVGQPRIRTGDNRDSRCWRLPAAGIVVVGDGCIGAQRLIDDAHSPPNLV
jgi:hypothetical protein